MQFDSFAALLSMQGHGPFVWSAYILTLLILLWLVISPFVKNKRFFIEQSMRLRREQRMNTGDKST